MVAIEWTVTGGIRFDATEIPVPSLIVRLLTAASAMQAYTSPHIICESANHACENPRSSISRVSLIARCGLVKIRVPNSIASSLDTDAHARKACTLAKPAAGI